VRVAFPPLAIAVHGPLGGQFSFPQWFPATTGDVDACQQEVGASVCIHVPEREGIKQSRPATVPVWSGTRILPEKVGLRRQGIASLRFALMMYSVLRLHQVVHRSAGTKLSRRSPSKVLRI
jgi:hypothetical protein